MPSRQDFIHIAADASKWMIFYNALFPNTGVTRDGHEMILHYDQLLSFNRDPVAVATLLLTVAITVQ